MPKQTALERRKALYPASVVRELEGLEESLGGRGQLIGLLTLAPLNADLRYVLGLLGDPSHDRLTLAHVCAMGNILPGDLMRHLGAAALLRGQTLAQQEIGNGIVAVASDVMRRAAPYTEPCTDCMVAGEPTGRVVNNPTEQDPNPEPYPCPTCQGMKLLKHPADPKCQELAIEMARLLPKGGGINIATVVNGGGSGAGAGAGSGALERLQTITDKILYDADAIDGEITAAEPVEASHAD